jgi:isocitrate dehydrogenase
MSSAKIVYTHTDEAPMLATYSFLPIIQAFVRSSEVEVEPSDISLAGRVIANFPETLTEAQKIPDELALLGQLTLKPECSIIKLPNISASVPQLKKCISELQSQGYKIPEYPEAPKNAAEQEIQDRYKKILGSAVNQVLQQAKFVMDSANTHPHNMGKWSSDSATHVASMTFGDFFGSEKSYTSKIACRVNILHAPKGGATKLLKEVEISKGEVIDTSCMNVQALREYFEHEMQEAQAKDMLLSLHLKPTMVSDSIIFGHAVHVHFKDVFSKYEAEFKALGVNPNLGLGDVYKKIANHTKKAEIEAAIDATSNSQPRLAMVNAAKNITNLEVSSGVLIDASMPTMIRDGGITWNAEDKPEATKALIPDRCYAGVFQAVIDFCKQKGSFDPRTIGTILNVGLTTQSAEEYGSHDKTFEIPEDGFVRVVFSSGKILFEHEVKKGDIWQMCQTRDTAIKDWIKLAVNRARLAQTPAIFWLDKSRPHDAELIKKVQAYLKLHDTAGLDIKIIAPAEACLESITRAAQGMDTISVTGDVLGDYINDLFPILELNASAKMLSIVPMIAGGSMSNWCRRFGTKAC